MKLNKVMKINGVIHCKTGLHIGTSKDIIEVGGIDNPVIRNPLDDMPYIPGSSLKGKIRSLLELSEGKISHDGKPHSCNNVECLICKVFGSTSEAERRGPTRIIVRDAFVTDKTKEEFKKLLKTKGNFTEEKFENVINRLTSKAEHPRTCERVPAGSEFEFEILCKIFDGDDEKEIKDFILHGLYLLSNDALGGCGSRGYGRVVFKYNNKENYVCIDNEEVEVKSNKK